MLCRKLIGISVAPDSISIMSIAVGLRSSGPPATWSASLGPGCIDPSSGALVCPDLLTAQLRLAPPTLGIGAASSYIALALPGQLFLTETWAMESSPHRLDRRTVREEALCRLPGDRMSLQIDCHLSLNSDDRSAIPVMVVAVRRSNLEKYLAALGRCGIHPESVVSSEIARFNSLCLARPTVVSSRALCVSVRSSVIEAELWEHGVLECQRRELVDGDIQSCVARLFQLDTLGSRQDVNREALSFDCIGIFGEASQSDRISQGLSRVVSGSVTRCRSIDPIEHIFGTKEGELRGCLNEAAGAIAPQLVGRLPRPHTVQEPVDARA